MLVGCQGWGGADAEEEENHHPFSLPHTAAAAVPHSHLQSRRCLLSGVDNDLGQ